MRTTLSRQRLVLLMLTSGLLLSAPGCQTTSMGWGWPKAPTLTMWNPWKSTTSPSTAPSTALASKPSTTPPPSTHATPSPTGSVALAQNNQPPGSAYANLSKTPVSTPVTAPTAYPTTGSSNLGGYAAQPAAYQTQTPPAATGGYPTGGSAPGTYPQTSYPTTGYPTATGSPGYQTGPYNTGAANQASPQTPANYPATTTPPAYQGGYNSQGGYQGNVQPAVVGENAGDSYGTPPASPRGGAYGGGTYSGASYEQPVEPTGTYAAATANVPAVVPVSATPAAASAIGPSLPANLSSAPTGYRPGSTGRAHSTGEVQQIGYEQPTTMRR